MVSSAPASSISATLQKTLNRLRQLNTQDIQNSWQISTQDSAPTDIFDNSAATSKSTLGPQFWTKATQNDRQHIAWGKGLQVQWFYQEIAVPTDFDGYPLAGLCLRLALTWWAEDAQIYVDGHLVQSGDLFECFTRICLSEKVSPGQSFGIAIRLVSPGHDDGALVRSHLIYELPDIYLTLEPSFVADELAVLATLEPHSQKQIESEIAQLDWASLQRTQGIEDQSSKDVDFDLDLWQALSTQPNLIPAVIHPFQQSLSQLRRNLNAFSPQIKARTIQCVGHAHLDMAWLWPISETWNAAERTFKSILQLQQAFPELTYTHSSPALFEWIEHNRPDLFSQIKQKVAEGSWSIDAGLWIEPEFNIVSGEAIARHILYAQQYCQKKFGRISKVAWLPDSFGFCWQLPQLLTQGGIDTFATLKLSWNDTTEFPHQLFWWQSPDGSRILSIMLPPIGTDIDPVKMANHAAKWEAETHIPDSLWLPGMGDHGGGPTRDMLEKARRWQRSPFFPKINFTSPDRYIKSLPLPASPQADTAKALPTWNDELYLELHRGCYTTHADQKQSNQQCEDLLYQAEVFAAVAQLTTNRPYPKADLDAAWKSLLFNQFHDILPGTSIPEVFVEADHNWQQVREIGQRVLDQSISAIASSITAPAPPHPNAKLIIVFNSLSWPRTIVVNVQQPKSNSFSPSLKWMVCNTDQQRIPHQTISTGLAQPQLLFSAIDIPAVGYRCFWLSPDTAQRSYLDLHPKADSLEPHATEYILENASIRAAIDPNSGQLISLIEKSTHTESLAASANQLQAFRDESGYWDAWNIAADYKEHPIPSPKLLNIRFIETGSVRQRLRVTYQLNKSTIRQDYILEKDSPILKVENDIDWQETQTLLKVNFPTAISADYATYEIPFGAITRTTRSQTELDEAKWEVPALRWANIENVAGGLSILTQAKHGFDASPNHLRLTLLKSPVWPDPYSDRGLHRFTYAIYPHSHSWQTAQTERVARELNVSPIVHQPSSISCDDLKARSQCSFIQLHNPNLMLAALKLAENSTTDFVLRCYETHGKSAQIEATTSLNITGITRTECQRVNILETPIEKDQHASIQPWEIASYRIRRADS